MLHNNFPEFKLDVIKYTYHTTNNYNKAYLHLKNVDRNDTNMFTNEYKNTGKINKKNNELAEEIIINNKYYGFIKILDIVSNEINHRCNYCCITSLIIS